MKLSITLLILLNSCLLFAQDYIEKKADVIKMNNGHIVRKIQFKDNTFFSSQLSMADSERNYILKSREFAFMVNGSPVDGFSGWDLVGTESIEDDRSGKGVKVVLLGQDQLSDLQLEVSYMLYPNLPLVRKWLNFAIR